MQYLEDLTQDKVTARVTTFCQWDEKTRRADLSFTVSGPLQYSQTMGLGYNPSRTCVETHVSCAISQFLIFGGSAWRIENIDLNNCTIDLVRKYSA